MTAHACICFAGFAGLSVTGTHARPGLSWGSIAVHDHASDGPHGFTFGWSAQSLCCRVSPYYSSAPCQACSFTDHMRMLVISHTAGEEGVQQRQTQGL